jgi:hypothetical protein
VIKPNYNSQWGWAKWDFGAKGLLKNNFPTPGSTLKAALKKGSAKRKHGTYSISDLFSVDPRKGK